MIRLLLALGLAFSFLTVRNSASMSRSYDNDSSPSVQYQGAWATDEESQSVHGARSGYIVASS